MSDSLHRDSFLWLLQTQSYVISRHTEWETLSALTGCTKDRFTLYFGWGKKTFCIICFIYSLFILCSALWNQIRLGCYVIVLCLPIFCLLHYFYSLLTLILCHSASKSLYPKIKLQEKAGEKKKPSHSPRWFYLLFLIMHISFLNLAGGFCSLAAFLINNTDEKSCMNVIV